MNIKLQLPKLMDLKPRLTVIGVGGAGSNAINNMIASGLTGVTFVVANTDAQSLANSSAEHRIQLGAALTEGLGAGAKPEIGQAAAEEAVEEIRTHVAGCHMVFIAAGMGGGTGTGAAGVIARIARESGALTVGVVTKPFQFEGTRRMRAAEAGVASLKPFVDTLIVIPNQNLFRVANEKTTFSEAFVMADQVLYSGIACVVDLIVKEGLINLDFADVRTIMSGMGTAMMGTGEASGEKRAVLAAEEAISNPLLDDISLRGAKGLLVSITGGRDLKLYEVDEAATRVRQEVDPDANIIVGATFDDTLGDRLRVSIVASGMERLGEADRAAWALRETFGRDSRTEQRALGAAQAEPVGAYQSTATYDTSDEEPVRAEPRIEADAAAADQPWMQPPSAASTPTYQVPPSYGQGSYGQGSQGEASYAQSAQSAPASHTTVPAQQAPYPLPPQSLPHQSLPPLAAGIMAPTPPLPTAHARPSWASPSGAIFEDAPPQLSRPAAPLPQPSVQPQFEPLVPHHGSFAPQPPAEPDRQARRIPEVEDFPVVGQREYRAKIEQYAEAPQQPQPRTYAQPAPEPPRKLGFFERLTGVKRREEPRPQPASKQALGRTHDQASPARRRADDDGPHHAGRAQDESNELPVFFGNDRK